MNRALSRTSRTFLQMVAGGGITALVAALVDALAGGLSAEWITVLTLTSTLVVGYAQNTLEAHGTISPVLETEHGAPPRP